MIFPQMCTMKWWLPLLVLSTVTGCYGKRRLSERGLYSKYTDDHSTGRYFIHLFEGTSNATSPQQLITYHPGHECCTEQIYSPGYRPAARGVYEENTSHLYGYYPTPTPQLNIYHPKLFPIMTPAPSLRDKVHYLLWHIFGLPLQLLRKVVSMFLLFTKVPIWIVTEVNKQSVVYFPKGIRESISHAQLQLLTFLVHIAVFIVESVLKLIVRIHGDLCIVFPDIPQIMGIFFLRGGKLCPFSWFYLIDVEITHSYDGEYWTVKFPFAFHDVDILFSSLYLWTPLGSPNIVSGFNLTAQHVIVNFTVLFSKDIFPIINPIRSIEETEIQVQGCTGNQPGAGWIGNELLKYTMRMCDPVLNEIIKVVILTGKINMQLVHWFVQTFIDDPGEWVDNTVNWIGKKITGIFGVL